MSGVSDYRLSRLGYYADFATAPAAVALSWALTGEKDLATAALAALCGLASWTLVEYWVHRVVFHGVRPLKSQHAIHHKLPEDLIGVSPVSTLAAFVALGAGLPLLLGASAGVGGFTGLILGYLLYILAHDTFHHRPPNAGSPLRAAYLRHELHHRLYDVNFGVQPLAAVWDWVFRTLRRPRT